MTELREPITAEPRTSASPPVDVPTGTPAYVVDAAAVPVTVVICARNRGHMIRRCLESVRLGNPAEIIVVDGNSTDDTAEIARSMGVTVVSDNGAGLGAARQLGARLAHHDYVIFVDTDVVIEPHTLRLLLDEALVHEFDALQAELRTWSSRPSYWQNAERWRRKVQMRKGIASVLGCQITLVRRSVLMDVGFDPAFKGAAEDADFCFRARAEGAVIAHSSTGAVAYHEDRGTLYDFICQKIWHGRGLARMLARYGRSYMRQAADQIDRSAGATRMNRRYAPYILVSWSFTGLGVALESIHVAFSPALRRSLKSTTKAYNATSL